MAPMSVSGHANRSIVCVASGERYKRYIQDMYSFQYSTLNQ